MQFAQFPHPDQGSNTVGFSLVSPVLVGIFLASVQIANLVNVKTTISAVANSAARVASSFDATFADGDIEARKRLSNQGITEIKSITVNRVIINGVSFVEIKIAKDYPIPWLGISLELNSIGRSIDEKTL